MKVGIITLPLQTNYGGILQAYALQTYLERRGHDVQVIDYNGEQSYKLSIRNMPLVYAKRIIENLLGNPVPIFLEQKRNRERAVVRQNTDKFIEKYIHRFPITDFSQIDANNFDAFVVGSDQVWRPRYFEMSYKSNISNAYLSFAKSWNVLRISYAASFGVDLWEYNRYQTKECRELLATFDAISVREDSAIHLCERYLGVSAEHMIDPTMLLSVEDYIHLIDNANPPQSQGQILSYILDNNKDKEQIQGYISRKTGYRIFSVIAKNDDFRSDISSRIQPSVESWLKGFLDAKLVITDSFHACVFSILFRKPFYAIINERRGASRFKSLLKLFGLEDRIIDIKFIGSDINVQPISESVYQKLTELKSKSEHFLNLFKYEQ
jgi:hypothetical protein